ncbi:MAG: hypothetical protein ACI9HK_004666, partial [Pirellulaceae bacterium]
RKKVASFFCERTFDPLALVITEVLTQAGLIPDQMGGVMPNEVTNITVVEVSCVNRRGFWGVLGPRNR